MRRENSPEADIPGTHGSARYQIQQQWRAGLGHFSRKLVSSLECSFRPLLIHENRDRTQPVGYKVSLVDFANGEPLAPSTSTTSYTDILTNADNSKCPDACFRPVGMAFDRQGRLFVSSDASGEIYVLVADTVAGGGNSSSNDASLGARSALSEEALFPAVLL